MNFVFSSIFLIFSLLIPVYLWGYTLSVLGKNAADMRVKFFVGMLSGIISVGLMMLISLGNSQQIPTEMFLFTLWATIAIFAFVIGIMVYFFTRFGSKFAQKFLRLAAWRHMIFIIAVMGIFSLFSKNFPFSALVLSIFFPVLFEESAKHFSLLSMLARQFSFSRRELAIFSVCVALGFAVFENILYFFHSEMNIATIFLRLFWVLAVHLSASLAVTILWWRALSFRLFSKKYFAFFFLAISSAFFLHAAANIFMKMGQWWVLFAYIFFAFWLFAFAIKNPD